MVVTAVSYVTSDFQTELLFIAGGSDWFIGVSALCRCGLATIPLALVVLFQFGWSATFGYLMLVYTITQILDGNLLVPLLFSEVVNLHPLRLLYRLSFLAVCRGFWGVFG